MATVSALIFVFAYDWWLSAAVLTAACCCHRPKRLDTRHRLRHCPTAETRAV